MKLKRFIKECHKREVFKMLSIYIVSSWVILQVLAVTWQPLGLPEKSITYLIIILFLGFPLNIYFIWEYRIVPRDKKRLEIDANEKKKLKDFQKIYFSILSFLTILSILSVALIVNNNFIRDIALPEIIESDKIAVLEFGNNTGDIKYDIVGKMTSDWIIHGITENQVAQVISQEIVNDYRGILKSQNSTSNDDNILQEYFKPSKIINGNFYLKDDKLLFQCSIKSGIGDKNLISFKPVECDPENPLLCIEDLKQKVLGYLITEDSAALNLIDYPAKFEAYQKVLEALSNYSDTEMYIELLNQAIAIDSNYFEPKTLRVSFYYNQREFKKADSLRRAIILNSSIGSRQQNLLNLYEALLHGKNDRAFFSIKKEYEIAPFDLQSCSSAMILALQYVNLPLEVEKIFESISLDEIEIENCVFCQFIIYVKGLADIELKKYEQAIELLNPITQKVDDFYLKKPLIAAYIRSGNFEALDNLAKNLELSSSSKENMKFYLFTAKELMLADVKGKAVSYLNKIIINNNDVSKSDLAETLYLKRDFKEAAVLFEELHNENPEDINYITKLSISKFENGDLKEAKTHILKLDNLRTEFQFGKIDYNLAIYYSAINNDENVYKYLLNAVADGYKYTPTTFQNDPHFKSYVETNEFKEIMNYWH